MVCRDSWVNDVVMDTEEKITQDTSGLTPMYYMPMKHLTEFDVSFSVDGRHKVTLTRFFTNEEIGLIGDIIRSFRSK